jgi:NH3-dependent NAD+ synthetase
MTDVPFGVLLSGGLDSSLVASITSRYLATTKAAEQWGSKLHSFCVGLEVHIFTQIYGSLLQTFCTFLIFQKNSFNVVLIFDLLMLSRVHLILRLEKKLQTT